MAFNRPSFYAAPVLALVILIIMWGYCIYTASYGVDAATLSVCYMIVGTVLSPIADYFVGAEYVTHSDVYRPYSGFAPNYMHLHPFLLGALCAAGIRTLSTDPPQSTEFPGPAFKISGVIAACGSLPVYTLGYASHRTPAGVVVAWQLHTLTQLLVGGAVLDIYHSKDASLGGGELLVNLPVALITAGIGFGTYSCLSAQHSGAPNRLDEYLDEYFGYSGGVSLRFNLPRGWILHVHHWLYLLIIAVMLPNMLSGLTLVMGIGFCCGGAVQGVVRYDDWHCVFFRGRVQN